MANVRASGQKMVTVWMKQSDIELMDASLRTLGYSERARLIRDAVKEKMQREGINIAEWDGLPTQRAGVAKVSSSIPVVEPEASAAALSEAEFETPESQPRKRVGGPIAGASGPSASDAKAARPRRSVPTPALK